MKNSLYTPPVDGINEVLDDKFEKRGELSFNSKNHVGFITIDTDLRAMADMLLTFNRVLENKNCKVKKLKVSQPDENQIRFDIYTEGL